ncbi:MAG: corrinoid protein [bacterium]|nr:corrinoid protein [bacterium]MDD4153588.1 corrinoid protein [bacterium]MDD4558712.1 corrinoid protein [bacterium]
MSVINEISEALLVGNAAKVKELVEKALGEGISPKDIIQQGLIPGMNVVGTKFKNNEYYVPEVLIAARAMHAGLDIVKPLLADSGIEPTGRVAIGTVKGDLHDIGKNLVAMMLEGAGFEVNDLGIDVTADKFVEAAKDGSAEVIAMSALLTTTMPSMADTIKALEAAGLRDKVKVMIGGAPVTQNYADEIGADGYSSDAASAVDKAKELLGV